MRNHCVFVVMIGAALAMSGAALAQERPPSNDDDEFRKVGSTLERIRTRCPGLRHFDTK